MVRIKFNDIHIHTISNSSGFFSGDNFQIRWKHSSKKNEGFGSISGEKNTSTKNYNILNDSDIVDTVSSIPKKGESNKT